MLLAVVSLLASTALFVVALLAARRWRRRGLVTYERDPDALGLPPAVCGYLVRGMDAPSPDDLAATVLDLVDIGVLDLGAEADRGSRAPAAPATSGQDRRYALRLTEELPRSLWSYEVTLLDLLFDLAGGGAERVTIDDVRRFSEADPATFVATLTTFDLQLRETAERLGVQGTAASMWVYRGLDALALLTAAAGAFGTAASGSLAFFAAGAVLAMVMAGLVWEAWRPSGATRDVYPRCAALRDYLRDFGDMREKPPGALVLWRRYLVFAAAFGLADTVGRELGLAAPGLVGLAEADLPLWRLADDVAQLLTRLGAVARWSTGGRRD